MILAVAWQGALSWTFSGFGPIGQEWLQEPFSAGSTYADVMAMPALA